MKLLSNKLFRLVVIVAFSSSVLFFQSCNQPNNSEVKPTDKGIETQETPAVAVETPVSDNNMSDNNEASMPVNFSVAYVNTDSLMSQYKFYQDASEEIQAYETKIQKKYEFTARKLKEDYEKYIEQAKAGMLTLKQQQDTEASLKQQQQNLMQMEQTLGQKSALQRQKISAEVTDTILSFIHKYRIEKNYTLILNYGSMSGLLSASKDLDITDEVIERLNAKYDFDKRQQELINNYYEY